MTKQVGRLLLGAVVVTGWLGCTAVDNKSPTEEQVDKTLAALAASNLGGNNLGGANLGGANLGGSNLGGANLGGNNLSGTNLGGSNLGGTNLGGNNLGGNNLGGTNLGGTNLGGSNLGGSNLGGSNLGGSNLGGSNLGGSNLGGNNLGGTNLGGSNLGGTNTGANIHALAGSINGMLYSGEDLWLPKTGQCIVMGLGSTAFANLLGQQSANAQMYAAVGKLPWGFASTSGGATTMDAWEVLVWGDKTYCDFVVGAPTGTAWWGVAGFTKSVFRWQAPATQSINISAIKASATIDPTASFGVLSYTGMAGAAAAYRAGTVSATNLVAGELGFVTATTNNQSVMVDFASWVLNTSGTGKVLMNVGTNPTPMYAEAVFYVTQNPDGTVAVSTAFPEATGASGSPPAPGMTDANWSIVPPYQTWRALTGPKPIPYRCAGDLFIHTSINSSEPVPVGKCDTGLVWQPYNALSCTTWNSVSGTTSPMNTFMCMQSPTSASPTYQRIANGLLAVVLSETYVHSLNPTFALNQTYGATPSASASNCATSQTPAQAIDNLSTPTNGTEWCAAAAPCTSAPISLMVALPSAQAINTYRVTSGDTAGYDPAAWTFQGCSGSCSVGSDTGWKTLDTRAGQVFGQRWLATIYTFVNSTSYTQYRLRITANGGSSKTQVGELELIADPAACVPETDANLCTDMGRTCGSTTAQDNCGALRSVTNCGTCSGSQTCGGGGVPGLCGSGGSGSSSSSSGSSSSGSSSGSSSSGSSSGGSSSGGSSSGGSSSGGSSSGGHGGSSSSSSGSSSSGSSCGYGSSSGGHHH